MGHKRGRGDASIRLPPRPRHSQSHRNGGQVFPLVNQLTSGVEFSRRRSGAVIYPYNRVELIPYIPSLAKSLQI